MNAITSVASGSLASIPAPSKLLQAAISNASSGWVEGPPWRDAWFAPAMPRPDAVAEAKALLAVLDGVPTIADHPEMLARWLEPLIAGVRNAPTSEAAFAGAASAIGLACSSMPVAVLTQDSQRAALREFKFWPSASDVFDLLNVAHFAFFQRRRDVAKVALARPISELPAAEREQRRQSAIDSGIMVPRNPDDPHGIVELCATCRKLTDGTDHTGAPTRIWVHQLRRDDGLLIERRWNVPAILRRIAAIGLLPAGLSSGQWSHVLTWLTDLHIHPRAIVAGIAQRVAEADYDSVLVRSLELEFGRYVRRDADRLPDDSYSPVDEPEADRLAWLRAAGKLADASLNVVQECQSSAADAARRAEAMARNEQMTMAELRRENRRLAELFIGCGRGIEIVPPPGYFYPPDPANDSIRPRQAGQHAAGTPAAPQAPGRAPTPASGEPARDSGGDAA